MVFEDDDGEIFLLFGFLLVLLAANRTQTRRWWIRPINGQRANEGAFIKLFKYMKEHDCEQFFKYTRMYPQQFDKLLSMVKHKLLKRSRRENLSPELRLAMTVKYLSHGSTFQNLAWEFRVGHSTVSQVIRETCEAIWEVLQPKYLRVPENEEWIPVADNFWNKWNFPNTLGAIDGKHIEMQCPINSGSKNFNYKQYFSIILLACCDGDYKFLWVDIGACGSENDASVFGRSQIGQDLETGRIRLPVDRNLPGSTVKLGYYFVADEAFPLKEYIMRPYPGRNLEEEKLVFNYRLSRARRLIENSFGILASRWRIYRAPILCSIQTCKAMVKATVCLHNFLRTELAAYTPPGYTDMELPNGDIVFGEWRRTIRGDTNLRPVQRTGANIAPRCVRAMRDELAQYLVSDVGSVPWQLNYVNRGRF